MGNLLGLRCYKNTELLLFCCSLLVLSLSFYFEYAIDLLPCPLCIMQRFCLILLLICTAIGWFFFQQSVLFVQICITLLGEYFALRQLWLQYYFVDNTGVCMPLQNSLHALFWGGTDCGTIDLEIAGMGIAGWSACYFIIVLVITCVVFLKLWRSKRG